MSTVGHMSPGQWKGSEDRSVTKRTIEYWTNLAQILERGDITALFLIDTYGGHATYEGWINNCIRRAAQWLVTDPSTVAYLSHGNGDREPGFALTASTLLRTSLSSCKTVVNPSPYDQRADRWNIVTGWKKGTFRAIGLEEPPDHDRRYAQADDTLWEGSLADGAVDQDAPNDVFIDPSKIRRIKHDGEFYHLESEHIVDPSPQRTPLLRMWMGLMWRM
ncbi:luciferase-like domain-containing protein [Aspergillus foveolatus]|uniref:luciferase-like domain-containing protein n=1 Tax=Aspergillus foveolatus TaxID=210207 RepID=UPI003CCCA53C